MSMELINRITIKKDGVYISTKSKNCDEPYRAYRNEYLSKVYSEGGQKALDRAIWDIVTDCAELRGNHPSIERYRKVTRTPKFLKLKREFYDRNEEIQEEYADDKELRLKKRIEVRTEYLNKLVEMTSEE